MTEALQRGSVVLRRGQYGVVWEARGSVLVVLPVVSDRKPQRAHDVDLGFGDLLAASIAMPSARIRAGEPVVVATTSQQHVGELVGPIICRMVFAAARARASAVAEAVWTHERQHRNNVDAVGVARV